MGPRTRILRHRRVRCGEPGTDRMRLEFPALAVVPQRPLAYFLCAAALLGLAQWSRLSENRSERSVSCVMSRLNEQMVGPYDTTVPHLLRCPLSLNFGEEVVHPGRLLSPHLLRLGSLVGDRVGVAG